MSQLTCEGTAWTFGNNVDTDQIVSGKYLIAPVEEQGEHVFESLDPSFPKEFKAGGIIVAGLNFGCGSSRENAPDVLKHIGAAAVIAESFARIFFRNAVAIGLPVFECPNVTGKVSKGHMVRLDLEHHEMANLTTSETLQGAPLNEMILNCLSKGGILKLLEERDI